MILAGAYFLIPETRSASDASANAKTPMLRAYVELFSSLRFTAFVMQTGMSSAVFFTMASAASTLMKDLLDRPAAAFGIWFTLFPLGYFLGNFVASRMSGRASVETMVLTGSILAGLTTLGQCLALGLGYVSMPRALPAWLLHNVRAKASRCPLARPARWLSFRALPARLPA